MNARDGPSRPLLEEVERITPLVASDPALALDRIDAVIAEADRGDDATVRARARRVRGRALAYAGRFEASIAACDEAAAIARSARDRIETGRALLASMHGLCELGRLEDAIRAGEHARDEFVATGESMLVARADLNMATAHHRGDDPAEALRLLDRARPFLADDPSVAGHVENTRGEALVALNEFAKAEAAFCAARAAFVAADQALNTGIAEGNLADLASRRGHLHGAVRHFEQARRCFESEELAAHAARLLAEQAETKAVLGMPDDALVEYRTALPQLERHGLVIESARAHRGLAGLLVRRGRPDEAEAELAAAASAYHELGHRSSAARVDLIRAELALSRGATGEARRLASRAIDALADRRVDLAHACHLRARIALAGDDPDEAEAELAKAFAIAREMDVPPLVGDILHTRAMILRRRGRLEDAVDVLQQAVEAVERVRSLLQADRFRAAWLGDRTSLYEDLVLALLDLDTPSAAAEAFSVAELAKSRSLLDQVSTAMTPDEADVDDEDAGGRRLLQRLHEVRSELNALYSRLDDDRPRRGADTGRQWQEAVHEREREVDALEARLAATRATAAWCPQPASQAATQDQLDAETVVLEYFVARGEVLAFVVRPDGTTVHRDLAALAEVNEHVARLQFEIDRALLPGPRRDERLLARVQRELGELHAMLLAPLREDVGAAHRLAVVPHGPLHLVPFHALHDGSRYLVETHEIHYAPSASVLLNLPPGAGGGREAVVVGVPDESSPLMEREAREVAEILAPSRLLAGDDAVATQLTAAAGDARVIHMSCHGRYSSRSPLGSGLRLRDRWLTVRDVYRMQLDADLVTLSGCETGVNLVEAGDELIGLVRGFLAAGARSVLVSLWKVDDDSGREFMRDFYGLWRNGGSRPGLSKVSVVRETVLRALARRPHPAFWAPFCLVGQP